MYSTVAYLYQQIHQVLMIDTGGDYFDKRWCSVYAKNLKINLGVDNVLLFQFQNQDQKPVNVSGAEFVFRLISQDGEELLYSQQLDVLNAAKGRAKATIPAADTLSWQQQPAGWSIEVESGVLSQAVFVDDSAGARGTVEIENSVFPAFRASQSLTIPAQAPVNDTEYFSSIVNRDGESLTTFEIYFSGFTGTVSAQGSSPVSTMNSVEWYDVDLIDLATGNTVSDIELTNTTDAQAINIEGYHPNLRLVFDIDSGNVGDIIYR